MRRLRAKNLPKLAVYERGRMKDCFHNRSVLDILRHSCKRKKMIKIRKISLRDFALHFSKSRNAEESAVAVGVSPHRAKIEGLKMLARKPVQDRINADENNLRSSDLAVKAGLERLAFGRANDAAELVFSEEITPHKLAKADLYNVSEIKKVKGGGVEIKFFDRQKALEKLWEYNEIIRSRENAELLAKALRSSDDNDDYTEDSPLGDDE